MTFMIIPILVAPTLHSFESLINSSKNVACVTKIYIKKGFFPNITKYKYYTFEWELIKR